MFSLCFREKLSCKKDLLVPCILFFFVFIADDLSCGATVNSISIQVASIEAMAKLGYSCSPNDVLQEVDITCGIRNVLIN